MNFIAAMQLIPISRNKKKLNDRELLDHFLKSGNVDFLGELYSRYMYLVFGVCLKYFKEPEKSKDAVILIYEQIQHTIHKHKIQNFKNWLYVVTKNHCLMELRKTKTGKLIFPGNEVELESFMENEPELHPIDKKQDENREKALMDCIEKLKAEQKECIRMFYFNNKCYRDIAERMKIEEKKVKSYIQNGKRNLKICMENKNDE